MLSESQFSAIFNRGSESANVNVKWANLEMKPADPSEEPPEFIVSHLNLMSQAALSVNRVA